jgi:hypothetical protein
MMVGSRFSVGADIPSSIPHDLHADIRAVEDSLTDDERATLRWTLTWLEGRPIVTLDNGAQIGSPSHEQDDD